MPLVNDSYRADHVFYIPAAIRFTNGNAMCTAPVHCHGVLGETATTGSNPATEKAVITYEIIGLPPIRINGFSPG